MSLPDKQTYDDQTVVRYLLGTTPDDETERFDELSIADDDFVSRLNAVEHDLVDAYVRGELSGDALERFQSFYLSSANRREKVRFAESLLALTDLAVSAPDDRRDSRPSPRSRAWFPNWGFAAAACVMLLAGAYLLLENLRLRDQEAALLQREQALQRQIDEQHRAATQVPEKSPTGKPAAPPRPVQTVAFVLLPQTRGNGSVATVTVPPGTDRAAFRLELESDDFPEYQAVLKDLAANRIVWRSGTLKAASRGETRSVIATLPAGLLQQQNYSLDLTGIPQAGTGVLVDSYVFGVVR